MSMRGTLCEQHVYIMQYYLGRKLNYYPGTVCRLYVFIVLPGLYSKTGRVIFESSYYSVVRTYPKKVERKIQNWSDCKEDGSCSFRRWSLRRIQNNSALIKFYSSPQWNFISAELSQFWWRSCCVLVAEMSCCDVYCEEE